MGGSPLPVPLLSPRRLLPSFFLPQHDINEAADETEGERHPGQHVGVAEVRAVVRTHDGVDDGAAHHEHTWGRRGEKTS